MEAERADGSAAAVARVSDVAIRRNTGEIGKDTPKIFLRQWREQTQPVADAPDFHQNAPDTRI